MNLGRRTHCAHETSSVAAGPNKNRWIPGSASNTANQCPYSRFKIGFQRLFCRRDNEIISR